MKKIIFAVLSTFLSLNCNPHEIEIPIQPIEMAINSCNKILSEKKFRKISSAGISSRGGAHIRVIVLDNNLSKELRFEDFYCKKPQRLKLLSGTLNSEMELADWHDFFEFMYKNGILSIQQFSSGSKFVIYSGSIANDMRLNSLQKPFRTSPSNGVKEVTQSTCNEENNYELFIGKVNEKASREILGENHILESIKISNAYIKRSNFPRQFKSIEFSVRYCD